MKEEFNHKHYNYKWTKGFLLAFFIAIVLLMSAAYAQIVSGSVNTPSGYSIDATTGNLIPYDSSLKTDTGTWSSTSGSSGGYIPYGSPQGSFNALDGYTFSYVGEELGIAGISLSSFPTGYQNTSAVYVTGFMYGLKYRFPCANQIGGSCTDTSGPQDILRVEVGYYPASGSPSFYFHDLGAKNLTDGNSAYNPNWQQLAQTVTFAAKPLSQAGAINMGIYGQDAGFWACLMPDCYGPQVKDAYIRANYSVDPCILNPAFNPSCPGFQNILQGGKSPAFYYSYNIAQSLPHIGGGVILHGYDYGFSWYNYGACYNTFMFWCTDWRTDGGGNINFRISDKNNSTMFYDYWTVGGNNSGGSFSARYLFTESQNSLNMGNIQWWTDSVWNHFGWTGWTRPIWTPDPCYEQPLYSPNCSNFDAEIKRLAAEQKAIQDAQLATTVASTATTPTSTVTTTITDATTTNPTVTVTTVQTTSPQSTSSEQTTSQSTTSSSSSPSQRPETPSISDSTNFALSLVRQNQQRETAIATQASQNAIETASIAATNSIKQAESIGLEAAAKSSIQDSEVHSESAQVNPNNRTEQLFNIGPAPGSLSVVNLAIQQRNTQMQQTDNYVQQQASSTSTSAVVQFNAMTQSATQQFQVFNPLQQPVQQITSPQQATAYVAPSQQQTFETKTHETNVQELVTNTNTQIVILQQPQIPSTEIQQQTIQSIVVAPVTVVDIPQTQSNFTTDKTNPINDLLENKQIAQDTERKETGTQTVKQNVQDNDAAAGVSIANIATTPVGFNSYMVALSDANFYAPKEIYRNQKTIDNARALRQLASDRLHQQMVDQQYLPR